MAALSVEERRELVRGYHRQGLSPAAIISRLDAKQYFPTTKTYSAKRNLIREDLRFIAAEDRRRYAHTLDEINAALIAYVGRTEHLYGKAVENGEIDLARQLSKDLARAYGVQTDEPVKVELDMASLMKDAFLSAQAKRKAIPAVARTIAAPPPPASPSPPEPHADPPPPVASE